MEIIKDVKFGKEIIKIKSRKSLFDVDFQKLTKDISKISAQEEFIEYLESYFSEIENYFESLEDDEIQAIKFDIEDLLYDLSDKKLIQIQNSQIVNAFILLLGEKFIQTGMLGAISIVYNYAPDGGVKKRLEASKVYLKVNDISKDYNTKKILKILDLLEDSAQKDEYNTKAIKSFFYFIESAFLRFQWVSNELFAKELISEIVSQKSNFLFLQDRFLEEFFDAIGKLDIASSLELIKELLAKTIIAKPICNVEQIRAQKETSGYAHTLYALENPNFASIRDVSYRYIQSIGDPVDLYDRLQRGEAIIDDEKLLYKYITSFGGKHKLKLDSAYELIIEKLQNEVFDIVDWGCGQATATMLLLDYANSHNIDLNIDTITLIDPSSMALSRGLIHIDVLKQKEYNIKSINSDFDCLNESEIQKNSKNKTLHIFSNVLDLESFALDYNFFKKVSATLSNDALFICISPNRNDKLNNRLELFFKYFDENFDTELISSRDSDIGNSTRYEKIFEVKYVDEIKIEEKRQEIKSTQKNYHMDIVQNLEKFEKHIFPILDLKILENSLDIDPEYVIFKIRKVAEVITSKIYKEYESNMEIVSFNDKIRYLSYEKKVFDKTITNYVQTLRTIGNCGVHDSDRNKAKQKLDAHLMTIALVGFLQELVDNKLISN